MEKGSQKLPEIVLPRPMSPDNDIKARVNANLRIEPNKEEMKTIETQLEAVKQKNSNNANDNNSKKGSVGTINTPEYQIELLMK